MANLDASSLIPAFGSAERWPYPKTGLDVCQVFPHSENWVIML